jgi:imidazolonepropionase-like amidohydrolase
MRVSFIGRPAGSDAGSLGVRHGDGLHDDLAAYADAGLPIAAVLRAATSAPRRALGIAGGRIAFGEPADLACFAASPVAGHGHLRRAIATVVDGKVWRAGPAAVRIAA